MTDAEYILALEEIVLKDPDDMLFLRGLGCTRRVLRAHVEDWWEKKPGPKGAAEPESLDMSFGRGSMKASSVCFGCGNPSPDRFCSKCLNVGQGVLGASGA